MREILRNVLEQNGTLTVQEIIMHLTVAALLSLAIYVSYAYTHSGTSYSQKFNVSLMVLTVLTATVMTVIGNNIALSLGMVGALSVVRFRTAIKDSRDTVYIFWTIVVGICCGVGDYHVASTGSALIFIILLIMGKVKNENRMLLIVRTLRDQEMAVESLVFQYFEGKVVQRVKNTSEASAEMIFEISRKDYDKYHQADNNLTDKLYQIGHMDYVNIVTQSDEING
ncbi:DUF4956 domain-containing protein [Streptococcus merionis]|uniref:DUF4956 domain-containing protein n=1 Tax=Streptococcus merionis TaxID=400065 RepID=A0A239SLY0_9STRE|nr:DUF4956 domain-containing protein [Streptococcus merionis]SNU86431.1 Uncharacterised protein [Streptococcus merionis]